MQIRVTLLLIVLCCGFLLFNQITNSSRNTRSSRASSERSSGGSNTLSLSGSGIVSSGGVVVGLPNNTHGFYLKLLMQSLFEAHSVVLFERDDLQSKQRLAEVDIFVYRRGDRVGEVAAQLVSSQNKHVRRPFVIEVSGEAWEHYGPAADSKSHSVNELET